MSVRLPVVLVLVALAAVPAAAQEVWTDVAARAVASASRALPAEYRALALDRRTMDARLASASAERTPGSLAGAAEIPLPLPDGTTPRFRVVESSVMAPALQARYPHLRTYVGTRADDPRTTVRLSATPSGVSAWIQGPDGLSLVDAIGDYHVAYRRADATAPAGWEEARRMERVEGAEHRASMGSASPAAARRAEHGEILRIYELAVATTGEYAQFHGGTIESTLEAIVVAMARVNGLYERDFAVRMLLVEDNEKIIFTDAATDPFNDGSPGALFSQVQAVVDDSIGTDNYDIGHVFSTGGGGVAGFGVVCRAGRKAQGVTGLPAPIGDPFYVDYVAHEMGHQFRGSHTFNGNAGACGGGNRSSNTAYEPGSGSTIMAYAGICGTQNLQPNSDPIFHNASLREVWEYVTFNAGNFCADAVPTNNMPPVVTVKDTVFLPVQTPFELVGSATDETPDALTYIWEELDRGTVAGAPPQRSGFNGRPPLFRSFVPIDEPRRTFPQYERYRVNIQPVVGEALPTQTEELEFRLTVRDNMPGAGAAADAKLIANVDGAVGPFAVTTLNEGDQEFLVGSELAVTWDVAGTASLDGDGVEDADRVDIDVVDVLISVDNGLTFTPLALATPNDGAETITLPMEVTPEARILVRATIDEFGSSFFDLNDVPFAIVAMIPTEGRPGDGGLRLAGPWPNPARGTARLDLSVPMPQSVEVALFDALGRRVRTLFSGAIGVGEARSLHVETAGLAPGAYVVRMMGETGSTTRPLTVLR